MIPRRVLLAIALGAGALSGATFYVATQRGDVVVVSRDIEVPHPLAPDDVETRSLSLDLIPDDAARRIEDVVGLVPRAPILRGQLVLTRALGDEIADFRGGTSLAPGLHAIAIPVTAVSAVGGAVVPGSRVDVLAVPVLGRAPAGRTTELLVASAVVLDVRGESGGAFTAAPSHGPTPPDRIASVIVGVDASEEIRLADRIATSTFVLTLISSR